MGRHYRIEKKGMEVYNMSNIHETCENYVKSKDYCLKWFEEKYTSKNLPIDKYFLPVYEYCLEKQNYA